MHLHLKIKEVTPERAATNTKRFWGHDIKEVRNYNRTVRGNEAKDLIGRYIFTCFKLSSYYPMTRLEIISTVGVKIINCNI